MKRLTEKVWQNNQSWYYEALWIFDDNTKAKVEIRRNAFDNQSHANISFYNPDQLKWNRIASIPCTQMKCLNLSYIQKNVMAHDFAEDELTLLEEARMVAH